LTKCCAKNWLLNAIALLHLYAMLYSLRYTKIDDLSRFFEKKVDTVLIIVFLRVACVSQNNDIYFCVKGIAYAALTVAVHQPFFYF